MMQHNRSLQKWHWSTQTCAWLLATGNTLESHISSVIKQHNYKALSTTENLDQLCDCRNKENCPLDDKCLQTCIIYKADGITNKDSHTYYGASAGELKSRYTSDTNSFRQRHHRQDAELLKHIWKLQDKGIKFNVKWSVAAYVSQLLPQAIGVWFMWFILTCVYCEKLFQTLDHY